LIDQDITINAMQYWQDGRICLHVYSSTAVSILQNLVTFSFQILSGRSRAHRFQVFVNFPQVFRFIGPIIAATFALCSEGRFFFLEKLRKLHQNRPSNSDAIYRLINWSYRTVQQRRRGKRDKYKKLSYRWQTTRRIRANAMPWL